MDLHVQQLVAGQLIAQYGAMITNPEMLLATLKEKEPKNTAAIELVENLMGTPAMEAFMDVMNNALHPEHQMVQNNPDLRELYAKKGLANVTPDEVLATLKAPDKLVVMYDFDGVVASADHYHKEAFDTIVREYFGFADGLSDAENDKVRGMGRAETVAAILLIKTKGFDADIDNPVEDALALGFKLKDGRTFDRETWQDLAKKKNDRYREIIAREFGPQDAIPGTNVVMQTVARLGGDNVEATTSRNTDHMAEAVGALKFFDARSTGHTYEGSKPHPACFVTAAMLRGFGPGAIGIEDATKGVQSINTAGHLSIGLGQSIKVAYPGLQPIKSVEDIRRLGPANDWSSWNNGGDFITDRPDFWVESMKDITPEMLCELQQLALQKAARPGAKEGYLRVIADKLDQARKNPGTKSTLEAKKIR
jgi:beta-phosphoglucomutase